MCCRCIACYMHVTCVVAASNVTCSCMCCNCVACYMHVTWTCCSCIECYMQLDMLQLQCMLYAVICVAAALHVAWRYVRCSCIACYMTLHVLQLHCMLHDVTWTVQNMSTTVPYMHDIKVIANVTRPMNCCTCNEELIACTTASTACLHEMYACTHPYPR